MERKSKQLSTLNSDKKCEFAVDAQRGATWAFVETLSDLDLLSVVRGRVFDESTIGEDFGTRGGRGPTTCGSLCILISARIWYLRSSGISKTMDNMLVLSSCLLGRSRSDFRGVDHKWRQNDKIENGVMSG